MDTDHWHARQASDSRAQDPAGQHCGQSEDVGRIIRYGLERAPVVTSKRWGCDGCTERSILASSKSLNSSWSLRLLFAYSPRTPDQAKTCTDEALVRTRSSATLMSTPRFPRFLRPLQQAEARQHIDLLQRGTYWNRRSSRLCLSRREAWTK